jgi:N-acetylglucosaminyl-diphospho-decaprenol L-rhamnosyltransferase
MTNKVVISIINYKTAAMTQDCAQSALEALNGCDGRIVVVDNASDDGSVEVLSKWAEIHPQQGKLTIIASPENSGFSGGHNMGMAAYEADYYLLLNSDALLAPDFFTALLSVADAQPTVGLFAPRIDTDDGEEQASCFRLHGPASEFERAACTGAVSRALNGHVVSLGAGPDTSQIEWASFACILLRGEMVRQIGPMDDGYFLYYEDAEYSLRARRAGWGLMYTPQAKAVHFRGGSGPVKALAAQKKRMPPYYYASRTRFLYQAHGRFGLLAANLGWVAGRVIGKSRWLAGKPPHKMAALEGRDIWTNFWRPLGPRLAPWETSQ